MEQAEKDLTVQVEQLFKEKKYQDIIDLLPDELLEKYNNATLYAWKGRSCDGLKQIKQCFIYAKKAITTDPLLAIGYFVRGNAYHSIEEYNEAISDYNKAIELDEKNPKAYYNRGVTFFDIKEYDKAIADYSKAIELDERYSIAYNSRGNRFSDLKEYDKAINDYNKAIELNEKYLNAYYNRAGTNAALEEYGKAINDYKKYIELIGDPEDYFTKVAISEIEELKKKLANDWYNEVDQLVTEIKQLLLFDKLCITHYTSLSGAKAMILQNSALRLSEGAFLNDTSEGRELFKYLSFVVTKPNGEEIVASPFVEKPFIGSFVDEKKHDDLALWRMYGKEALTEAKGCALTLYKEKLINNLVSKLAPAGGNTNTAIQSGNFTFYKVAYRSKDEFLIPGNSPEENKKFEELLKKLKEKIKTLNEDQRSSVTQLLNGIIYLFKSAEYQYENEVRLVVDGVGFNKVVAKDDTAPKVYIELVDIVPALHKITLGPKVERADEWAAAFNYHIKETNKEVEIVISHLPFK